MLNIFNLINLVVDNRDTEGCHRTGNGNSKTTIIRIMNKKFCNLILDKNMTWKNSNEKLGFESNATLFIIDSLSPCTQTLS